MEENLKENLKIILEAASEKKAYNYTLINISEISSIADYFMICTANNPRQSEAIAQNIIEKMDEHNIKPRHKEGLQTGKWIILDYNSIVVHIFLKDERNKYELEKIWLDGKNLDVEDFGIENWS